MSDEGESIASWLSERGAQRDIVDWARSFGADWARLFRECPRGDWLLSIAVRRGASREEIAAAAESCARLGLDHVPDDDLEARAALDALSRGDPQHGQLERAALHRAIDVRATHAPDPALAHALLAIAVACRAYDAPEEAPMVPALVAHAAVLDAGDCAMLAALSYAQQKTAELVRERIDFSRLVVFAKAAMDA